MLVHIRSEVDAGAQPCVYVYIRLHLRLETWIRLDELYTAIFMLSGFFFFFFLHFRICLHLLHLFRRILHLSLHFLGELPLTTDE